MSWKDIDNFPGRNPKDTREWIANILDVIKTLKGTETYFDIYNFYNWYAYKHGIEGLDTDTQKLLNKFLSNPTNDDFSQLQLAEIYKLKDAIKQDKSAIEFVFKLCQRFEATKKAMEKIKDDGAII